MAGSYTTCDDNYGVTSYIVDATAGNGNFTTIAAALTAASAASFQGDIFIRPGTYNENPALVSGINLVAWPSDSSVNSVCQVIIKGKCTFSSAGTVTISGVQLQTNSDFCLAVTGSAASIVNLKLCFINCLNNTGISYTSTSASSQVNVFFCTGDIGTTGITMFAHSSSGTMAIQDCKITNSGSTTTQSTHSAGTMVIELSKLNFPINVSSAANFSSNHVNFDCFNINAVPFTFSSSAATGQNFCNFTGGSAASVSVSTTCFFRNCDMFSNSVGSAILGGGTVQLQNVSLSGSSTAITGTVAGGPNAFSSILLKTVNILTGSGSPNASVTAPQGSLFLRTDGSSSSTRAYINTNGSTGWTNITTAA